ncbi:MAG TPA: hypothetical protein H9850_05635 [Candidatus Anaerobiospirillum pullistercoris]|uniref:Uncharacterized protein n=1 Tax=Candidatus Anaerobiospirillum pullistercoris TaxID=2838452 RepID=A0A9D2B1F5_9GAMM|nr:hypothetical protein [Candidatus Anaerobiospirillum pullistercoris]
MAKLTFVIQAPVSDIATHACLLGILQDLQDYPEHQLERLVFVGPAAIFAAREDTVANQLRNIIFAGFTPAPFAYYEDEEEEEDEYDSNVEDDNFPFSVVYDGRGHLSLVPEFSNDYEDDPSEVLKRRTLLRQTEIVFEQLLAKYHKIVLQSKCEVFVHNVAAQHYQLTPENINSGWSFVDSSGLLDIMQAESKSSHEGDDQHLVFVWSSIGSGAVTLEELINGHKERKNSESQGDLTPELFVYFNFPRITVDLLSASVAANNDRKCRDCGYCCDSELWWRMEYGLNLLQEAARAKFRVKACLAVDIHLRNDFSKSDLLDINMPDKVRRLLVRTANKFVPFFYSDNGYKAFVPALKREVPKIKMSKASIDMTKLVSCDYAPLMLF